MTETPSHPPKASGKITPGQGLMLLMAAQTAFWTLAPALSHSAPPLDVVEMYAWGREGVVATFKHPNLPGLVLEAARRLTGVAGWPAYLVSQVFVCATFAAIYALGRDLMDARRALAGVLLLTGIYFFSWPTPEFNHNVAQMPFWAGIAWLAWRASNDGKMWVWVALGLCGGFSLWAKYSSAVLLIVATAFFLWDANARRKLATPGPYVALTAFALSAAPQALYLIDTHFAPMAYAARRSAHDAHWYAAPEFLLTLALQTALMGLLLLAAGLFGKRQDDAPPKPEQRALRFLFLFGFGPPLLVALGALISGNGLRASWGAPMLNLAGLIAIALLSSRFTAERLTRLAIGAGIMIALFSGLYFTHMRFGADFTNKPLKGNWPQAELTQAFEQEWRDQTNGAPLRIVAGDIWTAGLIGMSDQRPPTVLINGDYAISPWISPLNLAHDGVLAVWPEGAEPPAIIDTSTANVRTLIMVNPRFPSAPPLRINYVILPPSAANAAH